jgi:uncharacterized membrane protein
MIIMALDHVRDYFHADAFLFAPVDLQKTNFALFMTRFVTHFCAPVFVFLAGTSAFMIGERKGPAELSAFLIKRGIWLIVLELTVINFAWFFNIQFPFLALTVIWALAIGMIALSAFVRLPMSISQVTGVVLVFGHNLLDGIHVPGDGALSVLWSFLHEQHLYRFGRFDVFVGYPILPWVGVMLLGYSFGGLYADGMTQHRRKQILVWMGLASVALFVLLRVINLYGDLHPWSSQSSPLLTFLSLMNVTKYPPSLDYILVTLGPAFLFLAYSEHWKGRITTDIIALGRVPMFYYIVHILVIHLIALAAAVLSGFQVNDMVFNTWVTDSPKLKGYGFSLAVVYVIWIALVVMLLPLCKWYDHYKQSNRQKWWLSYL